DTYASVIGGRLVFTGAAEKILPLEVAFADGIAETAFGTYRLKEQSLSGKEHNAFDADKVKNELMLTSRREGDRFTFKNRGITKSLKKLFNEMKIPVCEREKMAVIRDGENIVWVEGVGVNADYIPCDNTKNIIVIKKDG
ncbi:MAG: tRNA lysidine(34) synthetase TilS, partial [Clostridia bacterium]|nr:tRNA lysidine(34) synthetase TilS [Clostridia bacterium]